MRKLAIAVATLILAGTFAPLVVGAFAQSCPSGTHKCGQSGNTVQCCK
jgi:hypothetical protein